MKKHELLIPVGNMESLYQAIHNGADAVYLGCKNFGARKFAVNFNNDEIIEAIKMCHLYGVRIYVTMNTLIKNNEVDSFLEQVRFLHKNGVDALIVQDFGMICLLREMFPNLEIHASTQANISSVDVCRLYHELGVKRVVFSRELSIDEIDSIDVDIEKEAFIHGALCISYSGICLMSSMLGGRSGNRGECAGSCRMPYSLYSNNKKIKSGYLLSTKELNTSSRIGRLLDSSIYSFKVEGRMKSPLYVGFITRFYRKLIDLEDIDYNWYIDNLKTIFNREFTVGRLFGENDSNFMNIKSPNHIGLNIGNVESIDNGKIKIRLDKGRVLYQNDAIRFLDEDKGFIVNYLYDKNGLLVSSSSDVCYVDNKIDLKKGGRVSITNSYSLSEMFNNIEKKKIPIIFRVYAYKDKPLKIEISDYERNISKEGEIVSIAKTSPMDKSNIEKHLKKVGDTPFIVNDINIEMDNNIFISVSEINNIRRELCSKLQNLRENRDNNYIEKEVSFIKNNNSNKESGISVCVRNREQLLVCLDLDVDKIFVTDRDLYIEYSKNNNIYYMFPREEFNIIDNINNKCVVSDYADYSKEGVIGNYTLNVTNIYTAYYLKRIGVSNITLSVELDTCEINEFISLYKDKFGSEIFQIFSYGRVENMIIKGNILDIDNKSYYLEDNKKRRFLVYYDGRLTHILNHEYLEIEMNKIKYPVFRYLSFYDEDKNKIKSIVNKYK